MKCIENLFCFKCFESCILVNKIIKCTCDSGHCLEQHNRTGKHVYRKIKIISNVKENTFVKTMNIADL